MLRSTPIQCLHTILLGPYKYFTKFLSMERLSLAERREIDRGTFPRSGLPAYPVSKKSLLGRDY
jgi:hypothetical protein